LRKARRAVGAGRGQGAAARRAAPACCADRAGRRGAAAGRRAGNASPSPEAPGDSAPALPLTFCPWTRPAPRRTLRVIAPIRGWRQRQHEAGRPRATTTSCHPLGGLGERAGARSSTVVEATR